MEKTWFLLVQWAAKNSKMNEKIQRQSSADVLSKKGSYKVCKIHTKTPVVEPFFNRVTGLRPVTLLKRDSSAGVFI